jgi:phosphoribosyl 1,2-cyclic phosphodiesterase
MRCISLNRIHRFHQVAEFRWHIIEENKPFQIEGMDLDITPIAVHHGQLFPHKDSTTTDISGLGKKAPPPDPEPYMCFGFIFGGIMVYMSDVSFIPDEAWRTIEARSKAYDVFVVDCLKLELHISHFGIKVRIILFRNG